MRGLSGGREEVAPTLLGHAIVFHIPKSYPGAGLSLTLSAEIQRTSRGVCQAQTKPPASASLSDLDQDAILALAKAHVDLVLISSYSYNSEIESKHRLIRLHITRQICCITRSRCRCRCRPHHKSPVPLWRYVYVFPVSSSFDTGRRIQENSFNFFSGCCGQAAA